MAEVVTNQITITHIDNLDAQVALVSKLVGDICRFKLDDGSELLGKVYDVRIDSRYWIALLHTWNEDRMIFDPKRQKIAYLSRVTEIVVL